MKVLFVHARPLPSTRGGAELTLSQLMAERPAGVEVFAVTPDADPGLDRFDAVVIAGLRPEGGLGEEAEYAFADLWATRLRGYSGRSVVSEHDVQPCAMRDARCVRAEPLGYLGCRCGRAIPDAFRRLYRSCSVVRFLSPGQRRVIGSIIALPRDTRVIAPPIDLERFRVMVPWADRPDRALAFADPLRHNSPEAESIMRANGLDMDVLAYGAVEYEAMPALLNRYRHVVMAPVAYHGFGRLAAEAMACGCKVLGNGRVGALTWADPVEAARQGSAAFWRMVLEPEPGGGGRLARWLARLRR